MLHASEGIGASAAAPSHHAPPTAEAKTAAAPATRREVHTIGFLGISDYGLGQFSVLAARYQIAFATTKKRPVAHADTLGPRLAELCAAHGVEFLGSVDANSEEMVARAKMTDLLVICGYDGILKSPVLDAPKHGVLNTHLGMLPLNRGCCPTLWAQLHGMPQGYTTYRVGVRIDHGDILDIFEAKPCLGDLSKTNREIYDYLASEVVTRYDAALDRFERGDPLIPCIGREAYHRHGMPNDGWLSFHWNDAFLRRFSLALDFAPYLPGRTRVLNDEGNQEQLFLSIEGAAELPSCCAASDVGHVLESIGMEVTVRSRQGAVRCTVVRGQKPAAGALLESLGSVGDHPIDLKFEGDVLPLGRYFASSTVAEGGRTNPR